MAHSRTNHVIANVNNNASVFYDSIYRSLNRNADVIICGNCVKLPINIFIRDHNKIVRAINNIDIDIILRTLCEWLVFDEKIFVNILDFAQILIIRVDKHAAYMKLIEIMLRMKSSSRICMCNTYEFLQTGENYEDLLEKLI